MKNVLVTGGAGFIGSNLVDELILQKYNVTIIDNLSTGKEKNINKKAVFYKCDIRDFDRLSKTFNQIDYVFHLAALPRIQRSIKSPLETNEVNVQGTLNVLEAATKNNIKKVIFASSSSVYGLQNSLPLYENMIPQPLSPYSLQKFIGEMYAQIYTRLYGLRVISLRFFSVYGPRQNCTEEYATIIGKYIHLCAHRENLPIYGDGQQTRDFTHVDDVIKACMRSMSINLPDNSPDMFNICSGEPYSVMKIAKKFKQPIIFKPKREGEVLNSYGNNSLAKKFLGWTPRKKLVKYLETI